MIVLIDLLRSLLDFFFTLTSSYGWSVILLSLAVTIIMLPLFWVAEVIQEKERARKRRMKPALDKLKDVDNQQEKYYYTKNIYRQHGYSPLYALTGLLGLFIQIPFFLAAYWMLLLYSPFTGVAFGPIADLSQPDGLISVGSFQLNLLPFLMTGVNLFAGYLYLRKADKNEKIQQLIIAAVFLLLLYGLPAALVLYWTMNNFFSIGKNWLLRKAGTGRSGHQLVAGISSGLKTHRNFLALLLFSAFPLLSFYFENIEQLTFFRVVPFLFATLIITTLLYHAAGWLFKDKDKAIIFLFVALVAFFSYGHLHDFIRGSFGEIPRGSLIGVYLFALLASFVVLLRSKFRPKRMVSMLSVFSIFLFSIMIIRIFAHDISTLNNRLYLDTLSGSQTTESQRQKNRKGKGALSYPDIYYLVMDGYANSSVLKDVHGFDNSDFEQYLTDRGFYIATEGRANYVQTHLSLAATLNMKQINYLTAVVGRASNDVSIPNQMLSDNRVIRYLKGKGYKSINFSSGWGATDHNEYVDFNFSSSEKIDEVASIFIQTTLLYPFVKYFSPPKSSYRNSILYTLENIPRQDSINEPKFIFAHIVCPHPPYVFTETGEQLPLDLKLDNAWKMSETDYYLGQLKYLNGRVKAMVEAILEKDNGAVIILQSDHGSAFLGDDWSKPGSAFVRERAKIFNAILMEGEAENALYPDISSVNTFPVVFNRIFRDSFELREDSTYFSSYDQPYNFKNVTEVISN